MREMKDSGVAWIGKIPHSWNVVRNKGLIFEVNERCEADTDLPLLSVSEYYGIAPKAEKIADGDFISRAESLKDYKICHVHDVVMNIMLAWKRAQGVSNFNGIVSPAYCVYRKKENAPINMAYYHYLIRSDLYISVFKRYSTGIIDSRLRLYPDKFLALYSHVPPLEDQQKIAAHLDRKCTQIDALISNAQQQIEKLKAYKQSLITETVTKGLNPDVPMKDSGVEWIGEIPEDWKISKVGLFYEILLGKMLQPNSKGNDTLEKYLCATNVGGNKLSFNTVKEMWFSKSEKEQYLLKKGDLLVVEGGDVASSAIIEFDIDNIYYQNALHRVRAKKGLNEFLRYWLMSAKGLGYFDMICNKATIAHFTKDKFSFLPLVVLSLEEQQAIVSYLDQKCTQIDSLIAIKQRKIEKLQQYKKSLIYEYVTGKKEV